MCVAFAQGPKKIDQEGVLQVECVPTLPPYLSREGRPIGAHVHVQNFGGVESRVPSLQATLPPSPRYFR